MAATTFYGAHKGQDGKNSFDKLLMSGSGLARSIKRSHQQREITRRGLEEQLFVNIRDAANI